MPRRRPTQPRIRRKPVPKAPSDLTFNYKDPAALFKFITDRGKILGRSRSGLSAKQQRQLAQAVKRARYLALLPFTQQV